MRPAPALADPRLDDSPHTPGERHSVAPLRHVQGAAGPSRELLDALTAEFAARAEGHDRDASFPFENFEALHRHGLLALVSPHALGGGGAGLGSARRVIAAVGEGDPSTALVLTMQYLTQRGLGRADSRWPAALRDEVIRSAVRDGALGNSLRVEPELGSPARGGLPATIARRCGDVSGGGEGWRLSGHKLYSTGIPALTWLLVWARTDEATPRTGMFLVPRSARGIRIVETWNHLGLRASGSHDVIFDDVRLPLDHAVDLREPAEWAGGPDLEFTAWMSVLLGALYDGVARAARSWLIGFLRSRSPGSLGAPLATLPRMQEVVGEIDALLLANRALLDRAVTVVERGVPPPAAESGLLKMLVTRHAIQVVERALQVTGNHGLSRHNPLERHHRNVLCGRVHTPQDDSALMAAGRVSLA